MKVTHMDRLAPYRAQPLGDETDRSDDTNERNS